MKEAKNEGEKLKPVRDNYTLMDSALKKAKM